MLQVRSEHPVFGLGSFEVLEASNPSVLAFIREYQRPDTEVVDRVLCVNNLAKSPQPVELFLSRFNGFTPGRADRWRALPPHRRAALLRHPRRRTPRTGSPWSAPTAEPGSVPGTVQRRGTAVPHAAADAGAHLLPPPRPAGRGGLPALRPAHLPACMHQASVGFHCPECVKKGAQKVYRGAGGARREPADPHPDPDRRERRRLRARHRHDRRQRGRRHQQAGRARRPASPRAPSTGARSTASAEGQWYRLITSGLPALRLHPPRVQHVRALDPRRR